jgi:hypothetical protein
MNERGEHSPRDKAPRLAEGESAFVKEREPKEDGRYIIFYSFDGEERGQEP